MCGILGVISVKRSIPPECLEQGLHAIRHRGPDGEGVWRRDVARPHNVALAHRRLSIIDLSSAGAQPMSSADASVVLTYNGEIYNYRELRNELAGLGYEFRSESDTEVLLAAYSHWGSNCLSRLNGMFAFAIWDERNEELFLARDRFGEKPLYYFADHARGLFAFASEIKALFATGLVPQDIDDSALFRFVTTGLLDGEEETPYRGVLRLLPARAARVKLTEAGFAISIRRYWSVSDAAPQDLRPETAAETFRELFEDSVRLRLRSDVPVGSSLSGGLDSSAVVCTIKQLGAAAGQKTFSARMPDPKLDEGPYIAQVLESTRITGYEVVPTAEELREVFERLCWHMEEGFPATSMFAQFLVMRLAREHGVTVLLDGQGADELLGGYGSYVQLHYGDLVRTGRFRMLRHELRSYKRLRHGKVAISRKRLAAAILPDSFVAAFEKQPASLLTWWNPAWLDGQTREGSRHLRSPYSRRFDARLRHDAFNGPLQALLRYGDRNSMAWSREVRQPFLDHRLAEFVFSLPPEHKLCDGMTKVVLRRAMRGIVPTPILDRHDKLGYQAPLGKWLSGGLRSWVENKLEQIEPMFDGRILPRLVERFRDLEHPLHDWREGRELFALLTLGECLRQMRDVATASPKGL